MTGITDTIWTPHREKCRKAVQSPVFRLLLQSRLLELALSNDDRVAVEALKILVPMAGEVADEMDPVLAALDVDTLEEALGRATDFIKSLAGNGREGSDPPVSALLGAEVLAALRPTKYASVPGGSTPPVDHDRVGAAGEGRDTVFNHQHASPPREE